MCAHNDTFYSVCWFCDRNNKTLEVCQITQKLLDISDAPVSGLSVSFVLLFDIWDSFPSDCV